MTLDDQQLGERLREAQRRADGRAPSFGGLWAAAEVRRNRRPARFAAAAAAIVAVIAVAILGQGPETPVATPNLVDVEELVASTNWVAPSDSLLPEHRFNIFQELPEMFESTGTEEGTLL